MASITLKGKTLNTSGELPRVGSTAPDSEFVRDDLTIEKVSAIPGRKLLNIFPSVDTPVCATSVRTFNQKVAEIEGVTVVNVSADLPFAQKRFCGAEGIGRTHNRSSFRTAFADDYGVRIVDGPLAGLCARAVVVLDEKNKVLHAELVPEIAQEPDYDAALEAARG